MYIIILSYKKDLDTVEQYLDSHKVYIDNNYQTGSFIVSGRRNPRTGGIIICKASSIKEVQLLIYEDPFYKNQVADYEIIEFEPTKYADGFNQFL